MRVLATHFGLKKYPVYDYEEVVKIYETNGGYVIEDWSDSGVDYEKITPEEFAEYISNIQE